MNMTSRVLPREEWEKLEVSGFPAIGSTLRPEDSEVVVIEDGDRIVATLGTFRVTHFESLWIAPEYRGNAGLGRKLIKAAISSAKRWTDQWVWGCSGSEHTDDLFVRMGGKKMPVDTYIIPIQ